MNHCSFCPPNQIPSDSGAMGYFDQGLPPNTFYNNAWYHYQSYLYYWNLYNAQHSQSFPLCECYEDSRQSFEHQSFGFTNRCSDCSYYESSYPKESYADTCNVGERTDMTYYDDENVKQEYDDEDDANDEDEFEVDESFYQFLKQSQKHKKEREKLKRESAKTDEYIEVGKKQINASTLPPEEHQEAKRKKEMEKLYGDQASPIMSLEASLQLHFDRNFDVRQPVFWPNIPLKF